MNHFNQDEFIAIIKRLKMCTEDQKQIGQTKEGSVYFFILDEKFLDIRIGYLQHSQTDKSLI